MTAEKTLRVATRGSALALWQTHHVSSLLKIPVEEVIIKPAGDLDKSTPIHELGGQGVFVKEVEQAVLEGRADFAVHSAKDLPSELTDGLTIAAVPERGEVRDAIVGSTIGDLPIGARVGTGSVRRRAQLSAYRPDLKFGELRGNIDTRLKKVSEFDAVVLAAVGIARLGKESEISEVISTDILLPQIAQGALALECRSDNEELIELLQKIEHVASRQAVDAERSFLFELGGSCMIPVGAWARECDDPACSGNDLHMSALIASLDGSVVIREEARDDDPVLLGKRLASAIINNPRAGSIISSW